MRRCVIQIYAVTAWDWNHPESSKEISKYFFQIEETNTNNRLRMDARGVRIQIEGQEVEKKYVRSKKILFVWWGSQYASPDMRRFASIWCNYDRCKHENIPRYLECHICLSVLLFVPFFIKKYLLDLGVVWPYFKNKASRWTGTQIFGFPAKNWVRWGSSMFGLDSFILIRL
jgi:hypothetical protein